MNHLEGIEKLNNRYFAMRHGEAETNLRGVIIGDPENGLNAYGLTDRGRKMVRESLGTLSPIGEYVIVSSDFLRTKQTAEIAREFLKVRSVILDERLRERYFGNYENMPDDHYDVIWKHDAKAPEEALNGVEPANHLMERVTAVIADMEHKYIGKTILLVTHGDPIQFLETALAKTPITEHEKYPLFDLGEIRELKLSS